MFTKLLIANRGEIACRIIKTARRMGIQTVAVYSQADANALHVRMADEAVLIGPAAARESYLVIDRIIAAARQTDAKAIHPGYGFLSENEAFSEACERSDIVFVGPPAKAIKAMGSKSAAKALMQQAGVPLAPGYHGDVQDAAFLARQAQQIGYPVLIKASAGGGGKGMRRVERPDEFAAALASCKREALGAFGDDHVLIEKYVLQPRHIEIQVFADQHGNCVHLFERDCSVQRRHQKVLEEAPAPGMTPERRAAMGRAAVDAAQAVGYVGAGTVEFIAHPDGSFYFMEMNTRLQVEHPVTEMITGVDLVEWQLRIANGEPLPLLQEQLEIDGHAIEARIYAEDPGNDFLPSTGRLQCLRTPPESDRVRVDTGVEQGDDITPHYDPMISKLIVWGPDRDSALLQMRRALAQFNIVGVQNNVEFLSRLAACPAFSKADLDTALIERERDYLFPSFRHVPTQVWALAALAQLLSEQGESDLYRGADRDSPWRLLDAWRLNGHGQRTILLRLGDTTMTVSVSSTNEGWRLGIANDLLEVQGQYFVDGLLHAHIGERRFSATVVMTDERRHVFFEGQSFPIVLVQGDDEPEVGEQDLGGLTSPMPGKVIALLAQVGAMVEAGTPLLVMEAMKMEHTILAPSKGTVIAFHFEVGDQAREGELLLEFEPLVTTTQD